MNDEISAKCLSERKFSKSTQNGEERPASSDYLVGSCSKARVNTDKMRRRNRPKQTEIAKQLLVPIAALADAEFAKISI